MIKVVKPLKTRIKGEVKTCGARRSSQGDLDEDGKTGYKKMRTDL